MSLTLLAWRRTVFAMYADVRSTVADDPGGTLERFRSSKDRLFAGHPDTPILPADRATFTGLRYWPYDPAMRFEVEVAPMAPVGISSISGTGDAYPLERFGRIELPMGPLDVFWVSVYGGGVFIPFRDATNGTETYGAGRYLLDTVKGADLGGTGGQLIVDFNYAYHPSCTYDPKWSCPLAPPANRLAVPIRAGERLGPPATA